MKSDVENFNMVKICLYLGLYIVGENGRFEVEPFLSIFIFLAYRKVPDSLQECSCRANRTEWCAWNRLSG